jgi:hypothetical protein
MTARGAVIKVVVRPWSERRQHRRGLGDSRVSAVASGPSLRVKVASIVHGQPLVRALDGFVASTPEVVLCSPTTVQVRRGLFGARGPGSVERAAAAAVDEEPGPSHADRQDADVSTTTSSSCVLTGMTPSGRTVRSTPPPTESSRSTTSSHSPSCTTPSARASVKTQGAPEQRRRGGGQVIAARPRMNTPLWTRKQRMRLPAATRCRGLPSRRRRSASTRSSYVVGATSHQRGHMLGEGVMSCPSDRDEHPPARDHQPGPAGVAAVPGGAPHAGTRCRQLDTYVYASIEVDTDAAPPRCRAATRHKPSLLASATPPCPASTPSSEPTGSVLDYAAGFALPALRNSLLPQLRQSFSVDALLRSV